MKSEHIIFSVSLSFHSYHSLHFRCLPLTLTIFLTTLYHCDTIFCDTLRGLQANHQMPSSPCKSSISATFSRLLLIYNLEDVELQIIAFICGPEDWVIRSLCTEFYLTQSFVCRFCRFTHGFCEKFLCHKM